MCIYKITNLKNDKSYIGLTTVSLDKRWKAHISQSKTNVKPLYKAIRKYGAENFLIETIYETESFEDLGRAERYYIQQYGTIVPNGYNLSAGGEQNQLDGNPRAKLSVLDVYNICEVYSSLSMSCSECYENYKNRISFSAFEKIWEGQTWTPVHMDAYTDESKTYHKGVAKARRGEVNRNGLSSDLCIMQSKLFYVNHSLEDTYKKYGKSYQSKDSFRRALTNGYKHIPLYKKKDKKWLLNSVEINIDTWMESNPVSTISGSGE